MAIEEKSVLGVLTAFERPDFRGGPAVLLVDDLAIREGSDVREIGRRLLDGLLDLAGERHTLHVEVHVDEADPVARALIEAPPADRVGGERVLYRFDRAGR